MSSKLPTFGYPDSVTSIISFAIQQCCRRHTSAIREHNHGCTARHIPTRLRAAAFGLAADLVLADGRMERLEGRFPRQFAVDLGLERHADKTILDVMRLKNSA
jgi:hypothetical protein